MNRDLDIDFCGGRRHPSENSVDTCSGMFFVFFLVVGFHKMDLKLLLCCVFSVFFAENPSFAQGSVSATKKRKRKKESLSEPWWIQCAWIQSVLFPLYWSSCFNICVILLPWSHNSGFMWIWRTKTKTCPYPFVIIIISSVSKFFGLLSTCCTTNQTESNQRQIQLGATAAHFPPCPCGCVTEPACILREGFVQCGVLCNH